MTMLVHLIDDRDSASIKRSGIKGNATKIASLNGQITLKRAVFAMPLLPNYFASNQWLRELKRRGTKTIAAAHVRLPSETSVWVGKYNGEHRKVPLGHAAGIIMKESDPRGWQVVVVGSVSPKSIHAIRPVPQVVGWRYFPESHDKGPWKCLCSYCLQGMKGEIKSKRLIRNLVAESGAKALNFEGKPEDLRPSKRRGSNRRTGKAKR
ncbi:MAG: hypothetical protein KF805_01970 [Phycisphaeraceae bacterium]|nr:hypothetical protein [Phycisphaeraceae bacterium]